MNINLGKLGAIQNSQVLQPVSAILHALLSSANFFAQPIHHFSFALFFMHSFGMFIVLCCAINIEKFGGSSRMIFG